MNTAELGARRLTITGRVQGVGFRPFVYRLAHELGVNGWVYNASGVVKVAIEGSADRLDTFEHDLVAKAPPLARPVIAEIETAAPEFIRDFSIVSSQVAGDVDIHVPPDQFACNDCLAEMNDPGQNRYRYPFINCTQCGPRYTIITAMPYDRPNTSMAAFPLCGQCDSEYTDPLDRRFHAQPLACPECGPSLEYVSQSEVSRTRSGGTSDEIIHQVAADIRTGLIIAIKGIGGYHLVCDATNEEVVARLRERKHRRSKPLAIMIPWRGEDGLGVVRQVADPTAEQTLALTSPERPIVLVPIKEAAGLAPSIAPGLDEVGIMLPYSPLHHLLLEAVGGPIVATSGNISGEPVITTEDEAERRLSPIADRFVHHDRPIQRPADDPVLRELDGHIRPIRLGRGIAPLEFDLRRKISRPTLAVGTFLKNTVALAWENRVVVSPHIGDLGSRRSREVFEQVVGDLQSLYGVEAERVVCDAHPDYPNARWARDSGLPLHKVYHHHAHASALAGEFDTEGDLLVFTWDGVGFGEDGTIWGGEGLLGTPGTWRRVTSFRQFRLPGGDKCVFEPWRTALSLSWEAGIAWTDAPVPDPLLRNAWDTGLNSPFTSAAGRLFDAAAVAGGVITEASYDGEAPILLEALSTGVLHHEQSMPLSMDESGVLRADWSPLFSILMSGGGSPEEKASRFHASLVATLVAKAQAVKQQYRVTGVGLSGGVFQNRRLVKAARQKLEESGFTVYIPEVFPCNDGGISFGQIIEAVENDG